MAWAAESSAPSEPPLPPENVPLPIDIPTAPVPTTPVEVPPPLGPPPLGDPEDPRLPTPPRGPVPPRGTVPPRGPGLVDGATDAAVADDPAADSGPLGIDLEWRAPAGCPGADRVVAVIAALVGRDVVLDPTGVIAIRADIVAAGGRWSLTLAVEGPGGTEQRTIDAPGCEVLTEAAALVIATNFDAAGVAAALARGASDERSPRRPPPDSNEAVRSGPRRVGLGIAVQGGPVLGATPKVTGWLQGGLDVSIGRAIIGAHAGHGFARQAGGPRTLRAALTVGGVRGCFAPTQGRLAVPLCGIVEAGAVTAQAQGEKGRLRAPWLGAGAGAGVQWSPHPRLALVGGVDALVSILRPTATAQGPGGEQTRYRMPPASVRATLGIAVRLR